MPENEISEERVREIARRVSGSTERDLARLALRLRAEKFDLVKRATDIATENEQLREHIASYGKALGDKSALLMERDHQIGRMMSELSYGEREYLRAAGAFRDENARLRAEVERLKKRMPPGIQKFNTESAVNEAVAERDKTIARLTAERAEARAKCGETGANLYRAHGELRREKARAAGLERALRPFAEDQRLNDEVHRTPNEGNRFLAHRATVGDGRRAIAALAAPAPECPNGTSDYSTDHSAPEAEPAEDPAIHACPGCGVTLIAELDTCGAPACEPAEGAVIPSPHVEGVERSSPSPWVARSEPAEDAEGGGGERCHNCFGRGKVATAYEDGIGWIYDDCKTCRRKEGSQP